MALLDLAGIALFSGQPLCAVISADSHHDPALDSELWCDGPWPAESPLVHFEFALPPLRARRLRGVGDFRALRPQLRLFRSR